MLNDLNEKNPSRTSYGRMLHNWGARFPTFQRSRRKCQSSGKVMSKWWHNLTIPRVPVYWALFHVPLEGPFDSQYKQRVVQFAALYRFFKIKSAARYCSFAKSLLNLRLGTVLLQNPCWICGQVPFRLPDDPLSVWVQGTLSLRYWWSTAKSTPQCKVYNQMKYHWYKITKTWFKFIKNLQTGILTMLYLYPLRPTKKLFLVKLYLSGTLMFTVKRWRIILKVLY